MILHMSYRFVRSLDISINLQMLTVPGRIPSKLTAVLPVGEVPETELGKGGQWLKKEL